MSPFWTELSHSWQLFRAGDMRLLNPFIFQRHPHFKWLRRSIFKVLWKPLEWRALCEDAVIIKGFRGVWKWFMETFPSQQALGARWALPWNVKHAAQQLGGTGLAGHFKLFTADSLFRATSLPYLPPSWMLLAATLSPVSWRGWTRCEGVFLAGRGTTSRCTWPMRTWWCH